MQASKESCSRTRLIVQIIDSRNQAIALKTLNERYRDFSPTIHWIFVLLPNVISNSLVHCLGHERAYRIRSFCSHSNGCMLRIGTPSPFVHPPIRIFLCSWLCLRLPARCVAVRAGRTGMVRYCNGKVVVRSANEIQPPRVDERNGDISAVTAERLRPALVLVVRVPAKFRL